jgi:outer membrane protein assembly factor BamB
MCYLNGSVLSMMLRLKFFLAVFVLITACSGPQKAKPVDLEPNVALVGIRTAWVSSIGDVGFPIDIRSIENKVYVAGSDGVVAAIDAKTGTDVWRAALGVRLSAGVGSDGRYTAVVSRDNEVITLSGGREIWRQKLSALTLTAPLVAGDRVFVLASDRSITAYDAATGRRLWQQLRTGESLVLGQSGVLIAVGDTLLAGVGGRLVGMNPQSGSARWEAAVAISRGTNEIERVIDLVSGIGRLGSQVCVRAFQTAVACVDANLGRVIWSKTASGSTGVDGDGENLFGTEADGKIVSWRRSDGERLWVSERLRFRGLTTPLLVGQSIVVGDESGLLHFLSRQDGSPLNRMATDGSPIVGAPVLVDQTLVAVTRRGGVFGFRPE